MPHWAMAAEKGICLSSHSATTWGKSAGASKAGRPKRTPLALAAAMPCCCRSRILSRSFWAAKERICKTRSAIKVPMRSLPVRVSSRGMSMTQMSAPISLVSTRHCSRTSS